MDIERQKLIEDLQILSIKKGEEFFLSSGQKSDIYVDVKQTMLYGPAMYNLAKLLHQQAQFFGHYEAVAGVPLGAVHLAAMVAMFNPPMSVVLIRQQAKSHGTQKLAEAPPGVKKIILLEDVITTGQSVIKAAKALEAEGFDIIGIVAVVDRRVEKIPILGNYDFRALVDIEELL